MSRYRNYLQLGINRDRFGTDWHWFALHRQAVKVAQKTTHGEFLLNLDEMFWHHDKTHHRLRPGSDWSEKGTGPSEKDFEAWTDVESYMRLFERINVLVKKKIIDLDTINRFYGYRISNIVSNDIIRQGKLENEETKDGWRDFIELARALERYQ